MQLRKFREFAFVSVAMIVFYLIATAEKSQAQVVFKNDSKHTALWRSIYARMPGVWKTNKKVSVREVADDTMNALTEKYVGLDSRSPDFVVDGLFLKADVEEGIPARIFLSETLQGESTGLVFVHEYGHFVWHSILSNSQRNRFRRLWSEQSVEGILVTDYAGVSVEEGFAEAFSFFIRRPEILRYQDFRSLMFLEDLQDERETIFAFSRNR